MRRRPDPIIRTFGEELAMELLTMLSTVPIPTEWLLQGLVVDDDQLWDLFQILRDQDFKIVTDKVRGRQCVWVAEIGWEAAEAAASGYLDRVDRD